jgi:type I restriction enzyme M protein
MTQQELASGIRRACDIMRHDSNCGGAIDYVEHLSWLLLLKSLDRKHQPDQETGESKPQCLLAPEYRWSAWVPKVLSEDGPHHYYTASGDDNHPTINFIRQDLFPYLSAISGSSEHDLVASFFKDRNMVLCASVDNLKEVLRIVDDIDFTQNDTIQATAQIYEELLQNLAREKKNVAEFYTPRSIAQFAVKITDPQIGETVSDPSCGSGAFLLAAHDRLKEHSKQAEDLQQTFISGQEKKAIPALFATVSTLLHEATTVNIKRQNALEGAQHQNGGQFDVILTNPPFGRIGNTQIQQKFLARSSSSELLYLQHSMNNLSSRDGARCGIIVPEGILFRRNSAFVAVKKELLKSFNLFMVVSLPSGTFAPYTQAQTSLLFFERPGPTQEVLYYKIPQIKKAILRNDNDPTLETSLEEALQVHSQWIMYRTGNGSRPQDTPPYWIEPLQTLIERGYDLSAKEPNRAADQDNEQSHPAKITARLLEHHHTFYQTLEHLHEIVSKREGL